MYSHRLRVEWGVHADYMGKTHAQKERSGGSKVSRFAIQFKLHRATEPRCYREHESRATRQFHVSHAATCLALSTVSCIATPSVSVGYLHPF